MQLHVCVFQLCVHVFVFFSVCLNFDVSMLAHRVHAGWVIHEFSLLLPSLCSLN